MNHAAVIALGLCALSLFACASSRPKPGEQAPDFTLPASTGGTVSLADFRGRSVVLAFFPKAFTGG